MLIIGAPVQGFHLRPGTKQIDRPRGQFFVAVLTILWKVFLTKKIRSNHFARL